ESFGDLHGLVSAPWTCPAPRPNGETDVTQFILASPQRHQKRATYEATATGLDADIDAASTALARARHETGERCRPPATRDDGNRVIRLRAFRHAQTAVLTLQVACREIDLPPHFLCGANPSPIGGLVDGHRRRFQDLGLDF